MLWYLYSESGWLRVRRSHPNIHGMRVLILLLVAVGAVLKMALVWWGQNENFYNDHGDRSGEVPKQACAPIQEHSGGYSNKVTEPRDWSVAHP